MLSVHGEDKIIFSNISKGRFRDRFLLDRIRGIKRFVRVSLSPSSGLHLGNLRSALVPYILYRSDPVNNLFYLRFNDLNAAITKEECVLKIRDELEWAGLVLDNEYVTRQSETKNRRIYDDVLSLLQHASYVKKDTHGSLCLNIDHPDLRAVHWFDINRGPVIVHLTSIEGRALELSSLSLADGDCNWFKYKFSGAVDDLLLSSLVVRDARQEGLTARQALICYAITLAWNNSNTTKDLDAARKRIEAYRDEMIGSRTRRPLPFLAPPIYCHVADVMSADSGALRKRETVGAMQARYFLTSVDQYRTQQWLPETVVSYLVASVVPYRRGGSRNQHYVTLAGLAGQIGVTAFLDAIGKHSSIGWLSLPRRRVAVSQAALHRQERNVIRTMNYAIFINRIRNSSITEHRQFASDDILERLYIHRKEFTCWRDLLLVGLGERIPVASDEISRAYIRTLTELSDHLDMDRSELAKLFSSNLKGGSPSLAARSIRSTLMGKEDGPPIFLIGRILGLNEVKARYRDE